MPKTTPTILPLSPSGAGSADYWRQQLDWAADIRTQKLNDKLLGWRVNAKAYSGTLNSADPFATRVNIEFEKTEQKRHKLLYRLPAIKLKPAARTTRDSYDVNPATGEPDPALPVLRDLKKAIAVFREVLTLLIGPKHANLKAVMDQIIFDALCPAGIGFVKLGYERYTMGTVPMQVGFDEQPAPGQILGLGAVVKVPRYAPAPNIVSEKYYASRISPARALVPAEFMGSDFTLADFLGHDFFVTPDAATKNGWNTDGGDIQGSDKEAVSQDDRIVPLEDTGRKTGLIKCREVFYYPANLGQHDNPDMIRRLVFVGGKTAPAVHEDFRDQKFDQKGKWIGGLKTLPIKVYTLRYVSDTAYPPSDCTITRKASDELAQFRTQQMKHRVKAVPRSAVNVDAFVNETVKQKFIDGKHYDDIPVSGRTDNVSTPINPPQIPPDNRHSEQEIKNDIDRAWGLVSPVQEGSASSATEVAAIAQATANRSGGEAETTVRYVMALVEGIGALVQLYADRGDYVEIVGENGAKSIEAWDKSTIAGEFLYEAEPDSSQAPDAAAERDAALNRYNLVRNDPCINPEQLLRDTLASLDAPDVDRLVHPVQPPPPPVQEKPRINVSLKGDDLNPTMPQYANVVAVLTAVGIPAVEQAPHAPDPSATPTDGSSDVTPAPVIDRERLRMAESDNRDQRSPAASAIGDTST